MWGWGRPGQGMQSQRFSPGLHPAKVLRREKRGAVTGESRRKQRGARLDGGDQRGQQQEMPDAKGRAVRLGRVSIVDSLPETQMTAFQAPQAHCTQQEGDWGAGKGTPQLSKTALRGACRNPASTFRLCLGHELRHMAEPNCTWAEKRDLFASPLSQGGSLALFVGKEGRRDVHRRAVAPPTGCFGQGLGLARVGGLGVRVGQELRADVAQDQCLCASMGGAGGQQVKPLAEGTGAQGGTARAAGLSRWQG